MSKTMKKAFTSLLFVLVFAVSSSSAFAAILKTPYLIYPGVNSEMEVLWQDTATETTNTLSWGTDTTYSLGTVSVPENSSTVNQHIYTITGLTPNTTYYYQVADVTNGVYGTGSFITAPNDSATSIRFLAMGDSRSDPIQLDAAMQAMRAFYTVPGNSDYQRLVIHNGDWVSSDGESYWTTQWFSPANMLDVRTFTANSPINGCKGNHDNGGSYPNGYSATFPKYFPFPFANLTNRTTSNTNPACTTHDASGNCLDSSNPPNHQYFNLYWSFDYGPVHVTILDEYSNLAPGSAQYTWLVNDLSTTTKPWKILMYHEPAYSAGSDGDNITVRALSLSLPSITWI